jgi:serine/threonine protein phosphatase PrpC
MVVIHSFAGSDKGLVRPNNEDAFLLYAPEGKELQGGKSILAVVADGVGGGACGDKASQMAVTTIREWYTRSKDTQTAFSIQDSFRAANAAIHHTAANDPQCRGMATTCTALVIQGSTGIIGHVGDSRAYLFRNGELHQITRDHTLVNSLVQDGLLSAEDAKDHPRRNVILKALGHLPDINPDVYEINIAKDDSFLLCSDGLYALVSNNDIVSILRKFPVKDSGAKLINLAKKKGGIDNITVVILTFRQVENFGENATAVKTKPFATLSIDKHGLSLWLSIVIALLVLAIVFYFFTSLS